jgi:uncharacterized protein YecA (UPF0149 family)
VGNGLTIREGFYEEHNKEFRFFETASLRIERKTVSNFPADDGKIKRPKIGRNESCPCGSGRKYKHCHGPLSVRR